MHYLYIIKSLNFKKLYIGYSKNVVKRLKEHNDGLSVATKPYRPWQIMYLEGYADENDARYREKMLKQFGKVYSQLKRRIWRSLNTEKVRG